MRPSGMIKSDQVGKALFHFPKLTNTGPKEEQRNGDAEQETWQIERAFAPQQAPSKPVDNARHRIEVICQAPWLRDDVRAEPDRRHIEAELHDERDDVAEVAVFDVQRSDPHADANARDESNRREYRQQHDLPAGRETIPAHEHE